MIQKIDRIFQKSRTKKLLQQTLCLSMRETDMLLRDWAKGNKICRKLWITIRDYLKSLLESLIWFIIPRISQNQLILTKRSLRITYMEVIVFKISTINYIKQETPNSVFQMNSPIYQSVIEPIIPTTMDNLLNSLYLNLWLQLIEFQIIFRILKMP